MKSLITTVLIMLSFNLYVYSQPIVNGQFVELTNNGTSYVVKVQISTNTGTEKLGDATIPFTFNNANLAYVSTTFSNFSGVDYFTATATNSIANRISLNIVLNNTSGGTVVSSTFMDVAMITFNTINPAGTSNLTFVSPLEFFSPNITPPAIQWNIGTFTNLNTSPLPVELSSFTASGNQNAVNLKWQTATEVNNYGFEVERSVISNEERNLSWQKVGFVNGNGNSNSPKTYSFSDNNPSGGSKFVYRLKQIDNDGQFEYSDAVEVIVIPMEYTLYQNYPNPFNPTTKIKFALPEAGKVVLKIYDMTGAEVAELVNTDYEAGYYEIELNASNLASGVYLYRLQSNNFTFVKKLVVLK